MVLPSELLDIHRRLGARVEAGRITGYSTLEKEDAALHVGCALFDRSDRGKLCLVGSERIGFLQGLCTNDVKSLAPGRGCYTAVLEPKGHLVADARVLVRVTPLAGAAPASVERSLRTLLRRASAA